MHNVSALGRLSSQGRFFALSVIAMAIAGCGGGGGGGGGSSGSSSCPGGFLTCSSSGSGSTATDGAITLSLTDAASGASSNTLSAGKPLTVKALVKDANGAVVPNAVVTFATDATLGGFDPASGTALTNSSGIASVNLQAASLASSGAATLTATASVAGKSLTQTVGYAVSPGTVVLANLAANSTSLSAYGSTSVAVQVLLNGALASSAQTVTFSSACDTAGKASITHSVSSVNGVATATYTDKGCAGSDVITASVQGASSSISLQVAAPQASNVGFVSSSPATIALAGTGGAGLSSDSIVTFKVVDSTNSPIAGKAVTFDLSTRVGGIKLNSQSSGTVQGTTKADGTVSVTVTAGTVPTPVWVTAVLADNSAIKTQSPNLTISTGRPTQDRFSLSIGTFNVEGWRRDGSTSTATVYAYDRMGNLVPDGTVVNFVSEGAGIQPSCTTSSGACSVTFTSGELRPRSDSEPSQYGVTKGRVTVLAYAMGEESFDDLNGNNVWDLDEPYRKLGDAFVDSNENGVWDSGEAFIAFGYSGACPAAPSDGRYYNAPSKVGTCHADSLGMQSAHVRRTGIVVLSSYVIGTVAPSAFTMPALPGCTGSFRFRLADENNNPMPFNATLSMNSNVTYVNDSGDTVKASVTLAPGSATVSNTSAAGGTYHTFTVEGTKCVTRPTGSIGLTVTSPSGDASGQTITIN
ncbi:MAG: hypothetical protein JSS57_08685 [Proteobacteria bacterium]|nr:hypothetical protein [Pseudomonadota bacterium]